MGAVRLAELVPQSVAVLGATGSIGRSTLQVVRENPHLRVGLLAAARSSKAMLALCQEFSPSVAWMADPKAATALAQELSGSTTQVLTGADELDALCTEHDIIVAGIAGVAGLRSSLAAARSGKRVLLANKESLVAAGEGFMRVLRAHGTTLLPIDSEHNALFQCLRSDALGRVQLDGVQSLTLTASGGPFRTWSAEAIASASPEMALAHPNWSMGAKVSIDSASMMNKGLELIEACHLFSLAESQVRVVIHPQSIVHSMVDYIDGSSIAQLGWPDMRTPIAHALGWPQRIASGVERLDLTQLQGLEFSEPDLQRFPNLALARVAMRAGGAKPAVLNAANEVAVEAYLAGQCRFDAMPQLVERALASDLGSGVVISDGDWESVMSLDQETRQQVANWLPSRNVSN